MNINDLQALLNNHALFIKLICLHGEDLVTKLAVNQISLNKKEKHKQITSVIQVNNINTRIQTSFDPEHNAADLLWVSFFFLCGTSSEEIKVFLSS